MRDVRRSELLAINQIIDELSGAELEAVILQLEDAHLYRWLREMDGIGGGNLAAEEEGTLFRTIVEAASAATIFRLAQSERGGKFAEIAQAVSEAAPPAVAIEFIEICAAHASHSDLALSAALGVLATLAPDARLVAYTALLRSGAAEQLAGAAKSTVDALLIERDDPLVLEFLEGVAAGLTGAGAAIWDLTGSLFVDSHSFREAWAGTGRTIALAWHDPIEFVAVMLDVDTLTRNPARWSGVVAIDLASFGVGRVARLGRLGLAAKSVADWIRRFGARKVGTGDFEVRAGHLTTTLDRLDGAADVLAIRRLLDHQRQVDDLSGRLEELPGARPSIEIEGALRLIRSIGTAAESLVASIAGEVAA